MPDFKVQNVQETPYLYVERRTSMEPAEIAAAMGAAFGEVWGFMEEHGVAPAGGALSVYYDYSPDKMTFRAGFTIARKDMAAAQGAVKADVTPGGKILTGTHKGAYSKLKDTYAEMMSFVQENNLKFTPPTWEVYLNSPDEVHEDQLLTELYQALEA